MFQNRLFRSMSLPLALAALLACAGLALAAQRGKAPRLPYAAGAPTQESTVNPPAAAAPRQAARSPAAGIEEELMRSSAVARGAGGEVRTLAPSKRLRRALTAKPMGAAMPQLKPGKLARVTPTTAYPYSAIGVFLNGCSGAMISKNAVLTSAYCFYDPATKKWQDVKWFAPGYDAGQVPFGNLDVKDTWIPKAFTDDGNQDYAYALVQLADDAAGDKTGWAGIGADKDGKIKELTYAGYPPKAKPEFSMWQGTCQISKFAPASFNFKCPIKGSDAGSPLLHTFAGEDFPRVLGVQIGPDGKTQWGFRMNDNAIATLAAWIDEMAGGGTQGTESGEEEEEEEEEEETSDSECTCEDGQAKMK